MGKRGPRPKPTKLKQRAGNPGKRKLKDEPQPPAVDGDPPPPAWLTREGIDEWRAVVPQLRATGLLSQVDLTALAIYCQCVGQYVALQRTIGEQGLTTEIETRTGSTYRQQAPEVAVALKLAEKIRQFGSEFGLTPSSRVGLVVESGRPADKLTRFQQQAKKPA